jgi:hypothetical protein
MHNHRSSRADRIDDASQDAYEQAFGAAIKAQHDEFLTEFDEIYRAGHPFKPDNMAAHRAAMKALEKEDD